MENPSSWKPAELVIEEALSDYRYYHDREFCGGSLVHCVADALRRAGHLKDQDEPEIGWDGLREHQAKRKVEYANRQAQDASPVGQREDL